MEEERKLPKILNLDLLKNEIRIKKKTISPKKKNNQKKLIIKLIKLK
jgi:hypothetical protein